MLITLEGIEGCGKTTQAGLLSKWLKEFGIEVLLTREPGGSELGLTLREILLNRSYSGIKPASELFLYLADRAQHAEEVIKPAVKKGTLVIVDRFYDSTLVYQGYGRGIDLDFLNRCNAFAVQGLRPDLTLVFDLNPNLGLARARSRNKETGKEETEGRFESEELEFHKKVRQGYLELARQETDRFEVIEASGNVQKVWKGVQAKTKKRLENNYPRIKEQH